MPRQTTSAEWKADCENYLRGAGSYLNRSRRYNLVRRAMLAIEGSGFLTPGQLIVDVGAGMCDFARYMYTSGEEFRYLPIDGSIDGVDINNVGLTFSFPQAEWYVSIETIEHLECPTIVLKAMLAKAAKGVIVTTPNPERTDVIALDPTHICAIQPAHLESLGFDVIRASIHYEEDTLVASYKAF